MQAATYFVTDVAGIALEMKYHAFGFYQIWQEPAMARKLIGVLMITNAFGSLLCASPTLLNPIQAMEPCTLMATLERLPMPDERMLSAVIST